MINGILPNGFEVKAKNNFLYHRIYSMAHTDCTSNELDDTDKPVIIDYFLSV